MIATELVSALIDIDSVTPFPDNPRRGDVEGIASSLETWGQWRPILVQEATSYVMAGNHVLMAAKSLGWTHINAITMDVDDTTARQILVADNQWSERGQNDPDALAAFLFELQSRGAISDALGFTSEALDAALRGAGTPDVDPDDTPPVPEPKDVWVKPGQLFALGPHRLIVGDCTDAAIMDRLMDGDRASMVWTDPPYGVAYQTKLSVEEATARRRRRDGLEVTNDAEDVEQLKALLDAAFTLMREHMKNGAAYYVSCPEGVSASGDVHVVFRVALAEAGLPIRESLVWVKDIFVMGRQDYHWRHEPVLYGWKPGAAHYFVADRTLDTVFEIPRPKASKLHPTMKPVALVETHIMASSKRGGIVLDPFGGSGTTLIAADRHARIARLVELDPAYAQVIVERWVNLTGGKAEVIG